MIQFLIDIHHRHTIPWDKVLSDILNYLTVNYHHKEKLHGSIGPTKFILDGTKYCLLPSNDTDSYELQHTHPILIGFRPSPPSFKPEYDFYAVLTSIIYLSLGEYLWSDSDHQTINCCKATEKYLLFINTKGKDIHNRVLWSVIKDLHVKITDIIY